MKLKVVKTVQDLITSCQRNGRILNLKPVESKGYELCGECNGTCTCQSHIRHIKEC